PEALALHGREGVRHPAYHFLLLRRRQHPLDDLHVHERHVTPSVLPDHVQLAPSGRNPAAASPGACSAHRGTALHWACSFQAVPETFWPSKVPVAVATPS